MAMIRSVLIIFENSIRNVLFPQIVKYYIENEIWFIISLNFLNWERELKYLLLANSRVQLVSASIVIRDITLLNQMTNSKVNKYFYQSTNMRKNARINLYLCSHRQLKIGITKIVTRMGFTYDLVTLMTVLDQMVEVYHLRFIALDHHQVRMQHFNHSQVLNQIESWFIPITKQILCLLNAMVLVPKVYFHLVHPLWKDILTSLEVIFIG